MRHINPFGVLPLSLSLSVLSSLVAAQQVGIEVTTAVDCNRKTQDGDTISVHYKGTLQADGSEFDSSYGRGTPFEFELGAHEVIKGWDQGLQGMCIGEGRKLTIPPSLGYGSSSVGKIPAGSTLIFETQLMGIKGVEAEVPPPRPTVAHQDLTTRPTIGHPDPTQTVSATAAAVIPTASTPASSSIFAVPPPKSTASEASPMDADSDNGECRLLGPYALLVQGALGVLALSSLVFKRWRETPRRPLKIWFFDVSKQVFGSVLLHLANILMSMLSSGELDVAAKTKATPTFAGANADGKQPNPCSFYLLNLAIDTTLGIPVLVLLLKILHRAFLLTPIANPPESIKSGNYGHPPRATWWLKQSIIYFLGLFGMKFCVFVLFQLLPWIAWVGDWALRWTEGSEVLQVTFVMFIFPLIMNALQYYIIDSFIKDPASQGEGQGYQPAAGDDDDESDDEWLERRRQGRDSEDNIEGATADTLKEANPTTLPVRSNSGKSREYDPSRDGSSSK